MVISVHYDWMKHPAGGGMLFYLPYLFMDFPASLQKIILKQQNVLLFVPDEDVVKKAWQNKGIEFPYWSKVWPAAIALSEFLLLHTDYIRNKKVLEGGAGLGLPSLVAAPYAKEVSCTDCSAEAVTLAAQSAAHNGIQNFTTAIADWKNLPLHFPADVLLLSDVNYEPSEFASLQKTINDFLQKETTIIICTPQRLMAKDFIAAIIPSCIYQQQTTVLEKGEEINISLFVLQKSSLHT